MTARDPVENQLSGATALAIRLGHLARLGHPLFELPEHPDEGRTQTNHDTKE
jgi:hypothetical protein